METTNPFAEELGARMAAKAKELGRSCGNCTLCCKIVPIETKEFTKPVDKWCQHCVIGKGCGIYADRPPACRVWHCQWLVNDAFDDYWFPAKAKMVVQWLPRAAEEDTVIEILIDPGYPNRWKEEPWFSDLKSLSRSGLDGSNKVGRFLTIIVTGGERQFIILPNKVVRFKHGQGLVMRVGEDRWEMIETDDPNGVREKFQAFEYRFRKRMQQLSLPEQLYVQAKLKAELAREARRPR
jgi:hypothetical protein